VPPFPRLTRWLWKGRAPIRRRIWLLGAWTSASLPNNLASGQQTSHPLRSSKLQTQTHGQIHPCRSTAARRALVTAKKLSRVNGSSPHHLPTSHLPRTSRRLLVPPASSPLRVFSNLCPAAIFAADTSAATAPRSETHTSRLLSLLRPDLNSDGTSHQSAQSALDLPTRLFPLIAESE
jgi:hypothetical protein